MLLPQLHTAKAGDGRHGQRQTAAFGLLPRRHDVCGGVALAHPLQYRVAAGLQPHVYHFQSLLPQQAQVVLALHLQAGWGGIARDPLTLGEQAVHQPQYLHQVLRAAHQGVAIGQKDPVHPVVDAAGQLEILPYLLHGTHGKMLVIVHFTEGAAVVAAPVGHLHDEAVRLAGRPVDLAFVAHGITLLPLYYATVSIV